MRCPEFEMRCPEFEDLLLDYDDLAGVEREAVNRHLASCPACREYREQLFDLDSRLTAALGGCQAPPGLRRRVLGRIPLRKPSWIPEVLDFVGWAAVLAIAATLMARFPVG